MTDEFIPLLQFVHPSGKCDTQLTRGTTEEVNTLGDGLLAENLVKNKTKNVLFKVDNSSS